MNDRRPERTNILLWWSSARRTGDSYAVVAATNRLGERGDWAAYVGMCASQEDGDVQEVVTYGAKLPENEARAFARRRLELETLPYRT